MDPSRGDRRPGPGRWAATTPGEETRPGPTSRASRKGRGRSSGPPQGRARSSRPGSSFIREAKGAYSAETRAQVLSELTAGATIASLVARHKIVNWRNQASPQTNPIQSDPDFRALTLKHLEEILVALGRVTAQAADAQWLGRQSAHDLAIFYGVLFDKGARILAALPAGDGSEPPALPVPEGTIDYQDAHKP